MTTITCQMFITKTVSSLDATTIANIITWVKTNVIDKLPADATITLNFNIVP